MSIITARFSSTCPRCQETIRAGSRIEWTRGQAATHVTCKPYQPAEGEVTFSHCGSELYATGEVIVRQRQNWTAEYYVVIRSTRKHFGEDAMSFGDSDDCGYVGTTVARPATDAESAPLREKIALTKARKFARAEAEQIAQRIVKEGERPEGEHSLDGDRLIDAQDIYGSGSWFVITPDALWYVRNNGMDGDDWSRNNVRTGGAGAIGWTIARDAAIEQRLHELDNILKENHNG